MAGPIINTFISILAFSSLSSALIAKRAVCTPTAGGSATTDDVPAIQSAISSCGKGGAIILPAGKTYYINSVLTLTGCVGCDIQVEGTLKVSSDLDYWQGKKAIISVDSITGAKVRSLKGTGLIDGNGQAAYDRFAADNTYKRPTLVYVSKSTTIAFDNLKFKNAPNVFHSAAGNSKDITYTNIGLTSLSKSTNPAKNTDGWDIGPASYVTVRNVTVNNQDDCVAFKPGANFVTVDTITCTGSHGLSVGSLGKTNTDTVSNIYVTSAIMINSSKAVGIKYYPGGHGHAVVSNVTYENVVVQNSDYGAQIQSCYGEDETYCAANPADAELSGIKFVNFSGTTSAKYKGVTANLNCPAKGSCGVKFEKWSIKAGSGTAKVLCANTSGNIGVTCTAGASG